MRYNLGTKWALKLPHYQWDRTRILNNIIFLIQQVWQSSSNPLPASQGHAQPDQPTKSNTSSSSNCHPIFSHRMAITSHSWHKIFCSILPQWPYLGLSVTRIHLQQGWNVLEGRGILRHPVVPEGQLVKEVPRVCLVPRWYPSWCPLSGMLELGAPEV